MRRAWLSLDSFTRVGVGALAIYSAVFCLFFSATWHADGIRFAANVVFGMSDPFASERVWAAATLAALTLFLLPVVLGVAIGAVLELVVRRRRRGAEQRLESLVDEIVERLGRADPPNGDETAR